MHMMHVPIVSFYTFFTNPFEDEDFGVSVGKPAETEAFELLAVPWLSEGELVQPKFIVHAASRGYMCRANMLSEVNDTRRRHKRSKNSHSLRIVI